MAMAPSAPSRPASAPSRHDGPRSATAPRPRAANGFASASRSCRAGRDEPGAWMHSCRCSTCAGSRPATSKDALAALLGRDAPNLSPSVIARLKSDWQSEYQRWQGRDLSARRYVYLWADGVYLQARMEPHAECMLVVIGATPEGKKELVGFQVGTRESAQSWRGRRRRRHPGRLESPWPDDRTRARRRRRRARLCGRRWRRYSQPHGTNGAGCIRP